VFYETTSVMVSDSSAAQQNKNYPPETSSNTPPGLTTSDITAINTAKSGDEVCLSRRDRNLTAVAILFRQTLSLVGTRSRSIARRSNQEVLCVLETPCPRGSPGHRLPLLTLMPQSRHADRKARLLPTRNWIAKSQLFLLSSNAQ
jgi:hypothetical protein